MKPHDLSVTGALSEEASCGLRHFQIASNLSARLANVHRLTCDTACTVFAEVAREVTGSDWTTIFVDDNRRSQPVVLAHVPASTAEAISLWTVPTMVMRVFESREAAFICRPFDGVDAETNLGYPSDSLQSALFAPVLCNEHCKAVVRCANSAQARTPSRSALHAADDLALLQVLAHTFSPVLNAFSGVFLQMFPYFRLAHDIRHEASWLRAILERFESDIPQASNAFPHVYFNDLRSCWHRMRRVIQKLDVYSCHELSLRPARLLSDVLRPTLEQLAPALQRRRITRFQIAHRGFADDRQILLDKELVSDALFNVVENAILHFPRDRHVEQFACDIECHDDIPKRCVKIYVRDNGNGIDFTDHNIIFDYGTKRERFRPDTPEGPGYGLRVTREILQQHAGDIQLTSKAHPTEFCLTIPVRE